MAEGERASFRRAIAGGGSIAIAAAVKASFVSGRRWRRLIRRLPCRFLQIGFRDLLRVAGIVRWFVPFAVFVDGALALSSTSQSFPDKYGSRLPSLLGRLRHGWQRFAEGVRGCLIVLLIEKASLHPKFARGGSAEWRAPRCIARWRRKTFPASASSSPRATAARARNETLPFRITLLDRP